MGVVYKLTQEVIDFALKQKNDNPNIGCRKLADIVDAKFNIDVSKSAINMIIKEAGLSQPVGRHRQKPILEPKLQAPKPKLDIPKPQPELKLKEETKPAEEKKEEILLPKEEKHELLEKKEEPQAPIMLPEPKDKPKTPAIELPQKPPLGPVKKEEPKPEVEKLQFPVEKKEEPSEIPEEEPIVPQEPGEEIPIVKGGILKEAKPEEPQIDKLKISILDIELDENKIYDCMGAYILKAAEFELANQPILAKLLTQHIPEEFQKELELVSDILLYAPIFGIDDLSNINVYGKDGLWTLAEAKLASSSISGYLEYLSKQKGTSLTLRSESTQFCRRVKYLKIYLEDNTVLFIDARIKSIWTQPDQIGHLSLSYYRAVNYVREIFVDNVQSVIMLCLSGYNKFAKVALEFIYACEGLPDKKIVKIELFDQENNLVNSFSSIQYDNLEFICGFWPWQKECVEFSKKANLQLKKIYSKALSRDIYYEQGQTEITQHIADKRVMYRFVLLKDAPVTPVRMGILSNIPESRIPTDELIRLFLNRWPNLEESYIAILKSRQELSYLQAPEPQASLPKQSEPTYQLDTSTTNLNEDVKYIQDQLNKFTSEHFFPPSYKNADFPTMKERFYSLPGRVKRSKDTLQISLVVPADYEFYKDLSFALRRINESDIKDSSQAKICVNIVSTK